MSRTIGDETRDRCLRYIKERVGRIDPTDPICQQLSGVMSGIGTMDNRIEQLEFENRKLKEEIKKLTARASEKEG